MDNLKNHKKTESERLLGFREEAQLRNDRGSVTSRTKSIKCACTSNDTRNRTWKSLTAQHMKKMDLRRFFVRKVAQLYQWGGSDTVKTKEHPEHNRVVQLKGKTWAHKPQNPMQNSGHCGLHGHGHFHQGLHGLILRRHGHAGNHHN